MEVKTFKSIIGESPKLVYREHAYWQLKCLMNSTFAKSKEFMFYGLVEKKVGQTIIVDRFELMPNQNCSAAYCEADNEKLAAWMLSSFDDKDRCRIRIHAHSHVNMATSPSGTDNDQILSLANSVSDYYVQLIVNHKNENTCNIYDSALGVAFNKVDQFILINNEYAYKLNSSDQENPLFTWNEKLCKVKEFKPSIKDGSYQIESNWLELGNHLALNMVTLNYVLNGQYLCIDDDEIGIYESEAEVKEIDELFDKMVKKSAYSSVYQPTKSDHPSYSYGKSYDSYRYPYGKFYDDYEDEFNGIPSYQNSRFIDDDDEEDGYNFGKVASTKEKDAYTPSVTSYKKSAKTSGKNFKIKRKNK